ncbi:efflux RND transporter permease subunit [Changchengzhania lutea]|uniref:efflux RND transporter permease subunit n=1 Tax=Changchengzhania lutea TaxID=2049305 RepID=UPI00115F34AD|nr:efflux RND transporter permease subunit [Changchengzhania lutea]
MNAIKKTGDKLNSFAIKWAEFVVKYKWGVLLFSILMAVGIASQGKMEFDADYHVFFSEDNPELLAFDGLQEKYTKDDSALIVLTPNNGSVFTKENLSAIEELTAEAWKTPFSSRIDAITNFQHTKADNDDLYVEDLSYETSSKSVADIQRIREIALKEPLLVNRLVNEEGTVTAINVTVKFPNKSLDENPMTVTFLKDIIAKFKEKHPQFDVHLSGIIMMNDAFFTSSQKDLMFTLFMLAAIVLLIIVLTRSIYSTVVTFFIILFSITTAIGFMGIAGIKLAPSSSTFPTIILTLAVADSIHILVTFLHNIRKKGMNKKDALVESLRLNFMPVFITSITTMIGFLSMNFGDVPPFADLGNIVSVGVFAAFVYSLTFLPAFLAIMPIKVKEITVVKERGIDRWLSNLGRFVTERPKQLTLISLAIIGGFTALSFKNEFDDEFIKYFDETVDFRTNSEYISQNLTGIYNVEYSIGSGESGGMNNPQYLKKLEEFEEWFKKQPEVVHVNAFTEVARRVNKSMHGDDLAYYKVPNDRQEAAQYLLLYEMSLPFGLDLNNQINVDKSETRVTVTTQNMKSSKLIELSERGENWLKENAPEHMHALGTSTTLMFSRLGIRQAKSMLKGNIVALILISLILMIALRNFKIGLISIIPNLAPVFVGFGLWALYKGQINTGMVIVFGMTLGIIVDDTVHFVSKFLRARRELGYDSKQAVIYAFQTVGKALVITTIVLLAGFIILSQSTFALNSYMARITTMIILGAIIIDFILLPSLLILVSKDDKKIKAKN